MGQQGEGVVSAQPQAAGIDSSGQSAQPLVAASGPRPWRRKGCCAPCCTPCDRCLAPHFQYSLGACFNCEACLATTCCGCCQLASARRKVRRPWRRVGAVAVAAPRRGSTRRQRLTRRAPCPSSAQVHGYEEECHDCIKCCPTLCHTRAELRKKQGYPMAPLRDFFAILCCLPCVIDQTFREAGGKHGAESG